MTKFLINPGILTKLLDHYIYVYKVFCFSPDYFMFIYGNGVIACQHKRKFAQGKA